MNVNCVRPPTPSSSTVTTTGEQWQGTPQKLRRCQGHTYPKGKTGSFRYSIHSASYLSYALTLQLHLTFLSLVSNDQRSAVSRGKGSQGVLALCTINVPSNTTQHLCLRAKRLEDTKLLPDICTMMLPPARQLVLPSSTQASPPSALCMIDSVVRELLVLTDWTEGVVISLGL